MDKWRRTWTVCGSTWMESVGKLPFFMSLLVVVVLSGVSTFEYYQMVVPFTGKVTIVEVLANIVNTPYSYFVILGGLFVYLMQAPYFSRGDALLLPRLGRGPWIWGKALFVAGYCLLALGLTYLFALFICAPFIDFARLDWTPDFVNQYYLGEHLAEVAPATILLQTIGLNYLFLLLMAFLAMLLNLCYSRVVAIVVAGGVCVSSSVITMVFPLLSRWGLALQASIRYHQFMGQDNIAVGALQMLPTVPESLLLFAAGCVLCLILIRYRVRNYDFQLESKGMH